jgi:hypothetical protein
MKMKNYILVQVLICMFSNSFAQIFYKSAGAEEFKKLQSEGLIYIKTGNELDGRFEECLRQYWKSTKVRIIDPQKEQYKLRDDDVIISENRVMNIRSQRGVDVSFPEDKKRDQLGGNI